MAVYDQETVHERKMANCHQVKTAVKLHTDQMMRTRNFRVRNDVVERISVTKSQKGKRGNVERESVRVFSVEGTWTMFQQRRLMQFQSWSTMSSGNRGQGQRRKGRSSSPDPTRRQNRLTARDKTSSQGSSSKIGKLNGKEWNFRVDSNSFWKKPSCKIFASSRVSELQVRKRMCTWRQMPFPTCWGREKAQQEVEGRWYRRISCDVEVVSRILSEKVYSTWTWKNGIETHRQILQRHHGTKLKDSGKKGPIARNYPKVCASMSVVLARLKFEERSHEETLHQEGCARGIWRKTFTSSRIWTKLCSICTPKKSKGQCGHPTSNETRWARNRSWFRSIVAHDEQKKKKN